MIDQSSSVRLQLHFNKNQLAQYSLNKSNAAFFLFNHEGALWAEETNFTFGGALKNW